MDFWIIVFAALAFIAILGWIVNINMYYRKPPMYVEDTELTRELHAKAVEVEGLISEVRDALGKVIEQLPEEARNNVDPEGFFSSELADTNKARLRSYGFYRTGSDG